MHEFTELLTNPAHWGFEVVTDIVLGPVFWKIMIILPTWFSPVKRWVRKHDQENHGAEGR